MQDKLLELCTAQAVTSTAISENVITGEAASNIACGMQLYAFIRCKTAFTGSDHVTINVEMDSAAGLNATPSVLGCSGSISESDMAIGKQFVIAISPGWQVATDVYIGLRFTVTSSALTTGTIDAWITPDLETAYPFSS